MHPALLWPTSPQLEHSPVRLALGWLWQGLLWPRAGVASLVVADFIEAVSLVRPPPSGVLQSDLLWSRAGVASLVVADIVGVVTLAGEMGVRRDHREGWYSDIVALSGKTAFSGLLEKLGKVDWLQRRRQGA